MEQKSNDPLLNNELESDLKIEETNENLTKRKRRNSDPSKSQIEMLSQKKLMSFFRKNFSKLEKGSMRLVIITWMRMTMGIGVMTLPKYFSNFGILLGNLAIILAAFFCFLSFRFMFQCSIASEIKDFMGLTEYYLHPYLSKLFKFTLSIDFLSIITIYSILSWNLFEYLLFFLGLTKEDWIDNFDTLSFKEYHHQVIILRIAFFTIVYISLIFLFLKKNLESLKYLSIIFLFVLLGLLVFTIADMPNFYQYYEKEHLREVEWLWKKPEPIFLVKFFSLMLFFYVQPFVLPLRQELLSPTFQRLNKVSYLSLIFEVLICMVIGTVCYACLGDKFVPNLMILRKAYPERNMILEWGFRSILFLFFFLTTIGLACFNPPFRAHLEKLITMENKTIKYRVLSLIPFLISVLLAIFFPNVIGIFGIVGLVICNFNGFIIPALMKIKLCQENNEGALKICGLGFLVLFYFASGVTGILILIWQ